jgi:type IV pilus assembly protein PilC
MGNYQYIARTQAGAIEKDVMAAMNERAVVEALRARGLLPTVVRPVRKSFDMVALKEFFTPIKLLDKITFIKNLGVMIKAGLPVSKALRILSTQTQNRKFGKIVTQISKQLEGGTSLSDAISHFPNVFSPIFVSMVRVGEVSGTLEQNLSYLSDQLQRDYDLMSKTKSATTYPIMVLITLTIVGFLMFTFVLPKLTGTFKDLNVPLPILTRIVMSLVDVFAKYGIILLLALFVLVMGLVYWRKTESGRAVLHKLVLYTPVLYPIVIKVNTARFVRVFSSLIKSGMPIVESLEVSSHVVGNIYYQKVILDASSKVKMGAPLSSAFKKYPRLFSGLVVQMMEVGEESGTTDEVLTQVADFYEGEVDQTMKNMSSIIEPLIMMVIGSVVGILAIALISPIYNLGQGIN